MKNILNSNILLSVLLSIIFIPQALAEDINQRAAGHDERLIAAAVECPDAVNYALNQIEHFANNRNYSRAFEICNEWIKKARDENNLIKFKLMLPVIYSAEGDYENALKTADEEITEFKNNRFVLRSLNIFKGNIYNKKGDTEKAAEYYDKVINDFSDIRPLERGTYMSRANIYINKEGYDKAIEYCNSILNKFSDNEISKDTSARLLIMELFDKKADIYLRMGKNEKALKCYDELENKFPLDKMAVHYCKLYKAKYFFTIENYQKSLELYENILSAIPAESREINRTGAEIEEKIEDIKNRLKNK